MRMSSRVTVGHLRAAVSVMETHSFTESAHILGISQSSLSRRISDLERILSVTLLRRTTRSVEPSSAGRAPLAQMRAQMRATLVSFDKGLEQIEQLATGDHGSITIGCLPSIASSFLPAVIRDFLREHPDVQVEVRDALTSQVIEQVRTGQVDFAITAGTERATDLEYRRIGADGFYCALPEWHPLSGRDTIDWTQLSGERIIVFSPYTSISRPVELAFEAAEVRPASTMVAHNVGAVAGLVASGLGATAVPGLVRPLMEFAQVTFVPLRPSVDREISLIRRRGEPPSPAVQHFLGTLSQHRDLLVH